MTDIALTWDAAQASGDWSIADGDLALEPGLRTAILVSIFTDGRAASDFVPTDGTSDLRGWWADTYTGDPIGSRLWQYDRAKKAGAEAQTADTAQLPVKVRKAIADSLQWLVDDGVASAVDVVTGWLNRTDIGAAVTVTRPSGERETFRFAWAWEGI